MMRVIDRLAEAVRLHQAGAIVAARALYGAVLAEAPDDPRALYLAGLADLQAGEAALAVDRLARAAAARPEHVGSWAALAAAWLRLGDMAGALAAADAALRLEPGHARAWFTRGTALSRAGEPVAAVEALTQAVDADPDHADAWLNLGNALLDLDDVEGAERHVRRALALAPALAEAHASLGHILCCKGRYDAAIAACGDAIRLRPDFAVAHWNQGIACLLAGDFASGWEKYEWRKRHPAFAADFRRLPTPEWQGEGLAGRILLVTAEQGFGDAIQFARYLPLLRARGAEVVLACADRLIPLLSELARCVPMRVVPRHDVWVDQMSLPRHFATTAQTVPAAGGYLTADPARIAAWERRLPAGRRIGLVWAGNPAHSNDRRRSLPVGALADWAAPTGSCLIGLQLGPREGEAIPGLVDMSALLNDYAETAALLTCLDGLISVDTSVVHLAGALGRPCWVLLPYAPDWRWMSGRDDSPWYESVHLLRQERPGDWSVPLRRAAAALDGAGGRFPA